MTGPLRDAILQASRGASSSACADPAAASSMPRWQHAVDLGCGTGLMGPLLRPHVSSYLEGVDLSVGMVDKARERGCYDRWAGKKVMQTAIGTCTIAAG